MPIGTIALELEIAHAQSLKDRRQAVRSMKDKLRRHFNVSVAEMDEGLVWNRASLGVVAISASRAYLRGQMEAIERAAHGYALQVGAEIVDVYLSEIETSESEMPEVEGGGAEGDESGRRGEGAIGDGKASSEGD